MQGNENYLAQKNTTKEKAQTYMLATEIWFLQQNIRETLEIIKFDADDLLEIYPYQLGIKCTVTVSQLYPRLRLLRKKIDNLMPDVQACTYLTKNAEQNRDIEVE
ncbi:hypothetical protein [Microscilla marina]|uniref:Uncharacterized protein n=1 Tax=Microscilla marina ATCC 23134 TaxID=313606 RepID=A1ZMZ3_MICM2|nr:hypothetical protein [Microscilla marina]EAY28174.1 hypothetical protein M23134_03435 [Microscilla marina ATCC 23134]